MSVGSGLQAHSGDFPSAVVQYRGLVQVFQQCRQTVVSSSTSLDSSMEPIHQLNQKCAGLVDVVRDCGCKGRSHPQDLVSAFDDSQEMWFAFVLYIYIYIYGDYNVFFDILVSS